MSPNRLPQRLKQHVVGLAEKTADDYALGIDEVAQAGDRDANLATGVGDGPVAANITLRPRAR